MPARKKPAALKILASTAQPCRMNSDAVEYEPLAEVPEAPDWLPNAHAVKEFNRLAPILHANRILTDAGLMGLGHLCALHGKLVQLWSAGESPTGHLLSQYRALFNDFGLSPAAQGKVSPGEPAKKRNPFADNGRRS